MTKKDYIALAKLIKDETIPNNPKHINKDGFLVSLCIYLKSDNPNFNESKFREACGE